MLHTNSSCDWCLNLSFLQQHCKFSTWLFEWSVQLIRTFKIRSVKTATWELIYHSYRPPLPLLKHWNRCTLEEKNRLQIPAERTWKQETSCPQTQDSNCDRHKTLVFSIFTKALCLLKFYIYIYLNLSFLKLCIYLILIMKYIYSFSIRHKP